jgi:hypothetical protein
MSLLGEASHHPLLPLVLQEDADVLVGHRSTEPTGERRRQ